MFPAFVPPVIAALAIGMAAAIALFVNRANKPADTDEKYGARVSRAKAHIRARQYQPAMKRLVREVHHGLSDLGVASTVEIPDDALNAVVALSEWEVRIAEVSQCLSAETDLDQSLARLLSLANWVKVALAGLVLWLVVGVVGVLTSGAWQDSWHVGLAAVFVTVLVIALIAVAVLWALMDRAEGSLGRKLRAVEDHKARVEALPGAEASATLAPPTALPPDPTPPASGSSTALAPSAKSDEAHGG